MKTGQTISTTVGDLALEEYVPYEPSCYHYDPGWWAWKSPGDNGAEGPDYFVSEEGIVYENSEQWPDAYDVPCGTVNHA